MKAFEFGTVGLSQNDGMRMVGHEPSRDRVYASASIEVTGTGVYSWRGAALAADVQMWLDDASSNWGWILLGDESVVSTARRFDSRENAIAANRPVLIVHGTAPDVPVIPVTWGAVKAAVGPR